MSGSCSSHRPAAAAAAALALAGCYGDIPTHPFRIAAEIVATGEPLGTADGAAGIVRLVGVAHLESSSSMVIEDTLGTQGAVRISFDPAPAPAAAIPPQLDGQQAAARLEIDPTALGPDLEPLPVRALTVGTPGLSGAVDQTRFLIGEGTLRTTSGAATLPILVWNTPTTPDVPILTPTAEPTHFEPTRCGDVYHDELEAFGVGASVFLAAGQEAVVPVSTGLGLPAWTVHHVLTWHRATGNGRGCGRADAWTQVAAWR